MKLLHYLTIKQMNITQISQANGKDPVSTLGFTDDQRNAYNGLIEFIISISLVISKT